MFCRSFVCQPHLNLNLYPGWSMLSYNCIAFLGFFLVLVLLSFYLLFTASPGGKPGRWHEAHWPKFDKLQIGYPEPLGALSLHQPTLKSLHRFRVREGQAVCESLTESTLAGGCWDIVFSPSGQAQLPTPVTPLTSSVCPWSLVESISFISLSGDNLIDTPRS